MAKFEPWKPNINGDPDYPWHNCRNEAGGFTYWIPLECPNGIPADDSDDAEKHIYSWLPFFGGKGMKVCLKETTSREWAYDQKRWIDAEARRNQRRPKRETLIAEVLGDGSNDGNHKKEWKLLDGSADDEPSDTILVQRKFGDETEDKMKNQRRTGEEEQYTLDAASEKWEPIDITDDRKDSTPEAGAKRRKEICDCAPYRFPQTEPQALLLMELESVTEYLKAKNPRQWEIFFLKEWYGISAEEIAEKFNINPSRVYQLVDSVRKLGQRYREENR